MAQIERLRHLFIWRPVGAPITVIAPAFDKDHEMQWLAGCIKHCP